MLRLALLLPLFVLATACHKSGSSACPTDPSSLADSNTTVDEDIRELIRITNALALTQQMLGPMLDALSKAYPQVPAEFWKEMAAATSGAEFEQMIVDIYKQHLKHEDIRAMLAFNRSESGQNVIHKMPAIMAASQAAGQRWGQSIAERFLGEARNRGYKL
jgi:hypothetical protein